MKRFLLYILACFALIGCVDDFEHVQGSGKFQVVGRITTYGDRDVSTRSAKTSEEAYISNMLLFICDNNGTIQYSEFVDANNPIFAIDGDAYGKVNYSVNVIANLSAADKTTLIQTITENGQSKQKLKSSFTTYKEGVNTTANLFNYKFSVNTAQAQDANGQSATTILLERPTTGFPMVGGYIFKAKPSAGALIEIPLDCLFAKITFNMRIVPTQNGSREQFEMTSWQVHNLPDKVRLGYPAIPAEDQSLSDPEIHISTQGVASAYYSSTVRDDYSGKNPIFQTVENDVEVSRQLSFTFYMPENMIVPPLKSNNEPSYSYPADIDDDSKQHFKPEIYTKTGANKQNPTYVEIKGIYTDHQGHTRDIIYKVFLGKDNWSNFQIKRNGHYTNDITIRGITNNDAGHGVTLDHRVNVRTDNLIKLEMERETLFDCHWEIRPIRIDFSNAPAGSKVEIIAPSGCSWLSFESPSAQTISNNSGKYCDVTNTDIAYGKRRYFSRDLISNELNGRKTKSITITKGSNDCTVARLTDRITNQVLDIYTVWVYVDEYIKPDPSWPSDRSINLTINYYANETNLNLPSKTEVYTFKQKNIHKIDYTNAQGKTNSYYIEYYEEYLYNFDSKEQYGNTRDGMEWGLNDTQLSNKYRSLVIKNSGVFFTNDDKNATNKVFNVINGTQDIKNKKGNNEAKNEDVKPFYDFYIDRNLFSNWDSATLVKDLGIIWRPYGGYFFTKDIKTNPNTATQLPKKLATNEPTTSVIQYCLNKNKRIEGDTLPWDFRWYVPSIDEIEEICMGGYQDFEVFRNKYYWSSQPAYKRHYISYDYAIFSSGTNGQFYSDDRGRARATKVDANFTKVNSGVNQYWMWHYFYEEANPFNGAGDTYAKYTYNNKKTSEKFNTSTDYNEGNQSRTAKNRVRCVYKLNPEDFYAPVVAPDGEELDGDAIFVPNTEEEVLTEVEGKNIFVLWNDKNLQDNDQNKGNGSVIVKLTGVSSTDLGTKIKEDTRVTIYMEVTNTVEITDQNKGENVTISVKMGHWGNTKISMNGNRTTLPAGKFQVSFYLNKDDINALRTAITPVRDWVGGPLREQWNAPYLFTIQASGNNFGLKLYAITYENP